MHTLFGITLVLYLLKLSAGKAFGSTTVGDYLSENRFADKYDRNRYA